MFQKKTIQKAEQEFPDFQVLDDSFAVNCVVLESLKNTLDRFQVMHMQMEMKRARGEESVYSILRIDPLQWDQLPKMVALLTEALQEAVYKESDLWLICQQLELLIALLQAMAVQGVDQVDIFPYEEAYTTLLYFTEAYHPLHRYFIIDYLSQLGRHALFLVPDPVFRTPAKGCSLSLLNREVAAVLHEDQKKEPWSLVSSFINKGEIGDLCSEGRWLADLSAVQRMVWDPSPQIFLNFVEAIQNNLQAVLQEMDLRNPYFVYGMAAYLWKVVNWKEFQEVDTIVQQNATMLLKMISLNNANEDRTLPFNLGSEDLRQELLNTMEAFLGCWDKRIRTKFFVKRSPVKRLH